MYLRSVLMFHLNYLKLFRATQSRVTDNLLGELFGNFEMLDDFKEVDDYSSELNKAQIYEK